MIRRTFLTRMAAGALACTMLRDFLATRTAEVARVQTAAAQWWEFGVDDRVTVSGWDGREFTATVTEKYMELEGKVELTLVGDDGTKLKVAGWRPSKPDDDDRFGP